MRRAHAASRRCTRRLDALRQPHRQGRRHHRQGARRLRRTGEKGAHLDPARTAVRTGGTYYSFPGTEESRWTSGPTTSAPTSSCGGCASSMGWSCPSSSWARAAANRGTDAHSSPDILVRAPEPAGRPAMSFTLKDPSLLRQQCYINGDWVDADSGGTVAGLQPGHRRGDRHGPEPGRRRDAPRDRGRAGGVAGLGREDRQGARDHPAALVRPDAGERRRPRDADDRRAGQAARRGEGRDRLRGVVHRVVRRGRQARLRRRHSRPPARQAHPRAAPADRRGRRDHAVEFPRGDDHAQGRPGARRRLHVRLQARDADALLRARDGRAR